MRLLNKQTPTVFPVPSEIELRLKPEHYEGALPGNCSRCLLAQAIADHLQIPSRAVMVSGCHVEICPDDRANPPQWAQFYPRGGKQNLDSPWYHLHLGIVNMFDAGKTFEEIQAFMDGDTIPYELIVYIPPYPGAVL